MKPYIISTFVIIILIFGFIFLNKSQTSKTLSPTPTPVTQPTPLPSPINFTAAFTIITDNVTRNFEAAKYHHQAKNVYIKSVDPSIVHVTAHNITWNNFFKTLPMKLTKDCLTTGDGEILCDSKNGSLKFFLNDIETPNLLEQKIQPGDKILIKFVST